MVYYYDPITGNQVATAHQLVKADLTLGGGGKPDPKDLWIGQFHYHRHDGSGPEADSRRDPSLQYSSSIARWLYKRWRWVKCQLTGR